MSLYTKFEQGKIFHEMSLAGFSHKHVQLFFNTISGGFENTFERAGGTLNPLS